jgi:hypothetical protein
MLTTGSRVLRLTKYGLLLAGILSIWVLSLAILTGSMTLSVRGTRVGALTIIAVYLAGGGIGGAIVGALLPLVRWRLGSVLVGIIAVLPLAAGITYSLAVASAPGMDWITMIIGAVVLGGILGPAYREMFWVDSGGESH